MTHVIFRFLSIVSIIGIIIGWTVSTFAEPPSSTGQSEVQTSAPPDSMAEKLPPLPPVLRQETLERWKEDLLEKFHAPPFQPKDGTSRYSLQIVRPRAEIDPEFIVRPPHPEQYQMTIINPDKHRDVRLFKWQR